MTATLNTTTTSSQHSTSTATTAGKPWQSAEWRTGTVLAAVRVVIGFLFFCHGLVGLFGMFGGIDGQGGAVSFGVWPDWFGSVQHVVAGVFLTLGLYTRSTAFVSSGVMAYAYFVVHQPMGVLPIQNMGEPAALYCWIFLLIAVIGPGKYAVDNVLRRRRNA